MNKITPEKTYALLENLADYVMTEIPAIKEKQENLADYVMTKIPAIEKKQEKIADYVVTGFRAIEEKLDHKADKKDSEKIIGMLDAQVKNIDILRTEHAAISCTLDRHENRITALEEKESGYRVRDKDD